MRVGSWVVTLTAAMALELSAGCGQAFDPGLGGGGQAGSGAAGGSGASGANGGHGGVGADGGTGAQGGTGGHGGTGGGCGAVIPATIAACVATPNPNPDECSLASGQHKIAVDLQDQDLENRPVHGYVRFDAGSLPGPLAAVTLEMTATDDATAASDQSGEVWEVQPFVYADLFVTPPPEIGNQPVANSHGPVSPGQHVSWSLPPTIVRGSGEAFVLIRAASLDGVLYWNHDGTHPPTLTLVCE